jgi:hypothetical protein
MLMPSSAIALYVDGGAKLYIPDSGNVGIGTTSPAATLHISKGSNDSPTVLRIENVDTTIETAQEVNTIQFYTNDGSTSGTGITSKIVQVAENPGNQYGLSFYTYDLGLAEALRITNDGNVGIGTTDPDGKLHVHNSSAGTVTANGNADDLVIESNGVTGMSILSPADQSGNIYFGTPDDNKSAELVWADASDNLLIGTSTTSGIITFRSGNQNTAMTIDSSRNVGIGTTTPNAKLQVGGDLNIFDEEGDTDANLYVSQGSTNTTTVVIASNGNSYFNGGNVGIGTTSPGAKLDIYGDSNSGDNMIELINSKYDSTNTTGETGILFGWNNHVAARITAFKEGTVNRTGFKIVGEAGFNVPTTIATFRSTGRVGIGTTDPVEILHIGSGTVPAATLDGVLLTLGGGQYYQASDGTKSVFMGVDSSSYGIVGMLTDHPLGFRTNNTERMRILTNGNVGIGTTSPSKPLHVSSSNDAPIRVESTDATTGILFVDSDGSNALYYVGSGDYFYTSSKLGIGTTSPSEKLHLKESASNSYATFRLEGSNRGGIIDMYQGAYPVSRYLTDQSGNIGIYTSGAFGSTTLTEKFAIATNGQIKLNEYGAGGIKGDATYLLRC